jgi:hypothetical protein
MLKPRIKIVCPICRIDLPCEVLVTNANDASWAFTAKSFAHLKAASCVAPKLLALLGEDLIICKEAA